jgi:hypothetical protein
MNREEVRGGSGFELDMAVRTVQNVAMRRLIIFLVCCVPALAVDPPPKADFSAPDLNVGSDRRKATAAEVSPRNYLNQVSAWYFGHEG